MELRRYWAIIQRRLWIVLVLTLVALVASVVMRPERVPTYKITVKLAVKPTLEPRANTYYGYDEYYAYVASEYLVDDLAEVVKSDAFMSDLQARLKDRPGGPPSGSIEGRKAHRVLTLTISAPSEQDGIDIAKETATMLMTERSRYFGSLSNQNPTVSIVDPPAVAIRPAVSRGLVDIVLRTTLGLLAGLMIAFLLEYLDDTLHTPGDASELLRLPIVGEIPKDRRRRRPGSLA